MTKPIDDKEQYGESMRLTAEAKDALRDEKKVRGVTYSKAVTDWHGFAKANKKAFYAWLAAQE